MATHANVDLDNLFPHHRHHCPRPLERNCPCAPEGLLPSSYLHGSPCFSHLLKHKPCSLAIVSPIVEPLFKRQKSKCLHKNHH